MEYNEILLLAFCDILLWLNYTFKFRFWYHNCLKVLFGYPGTDNAKP